MYYNDPNDSISFWLTLIFVGTWLTIILTVCAVGVRSYYVHSQETEAVRIIEANYDTGILYLYLDESLVTGTDEASHAAAVIINGICETGWTVHVLNDWVPSKHNPITLEWSRILVSDGIGYTENNMPEGDG